MGQVLERSEIEDEDKWKVDTIYNNLEDWLKDYELGQKKIQEVESMKDSFLLNSQNFKKALLLDEETERLIEKLYCYASLKSNEDLANATYQELIGKASNLYQEYQEKTNYFVPRILKEDKSKILSFLDQEKDFESRRHNILDILRYQGHSLSEEEEKLLAAFSNVLGAGSEAADYLMDADMCFGPIVDEEGQEVELTQSNYSVYLRSKNREVRKQTFLQMQKTFGSFKNTLTTTLTSVINYASTSARLNHFDSSLARALYANNIPTSLYHNLIEVVHNHLPSLYHYFEVKKQLLGVDEFHLYDGYVSTVKEIDKKYPFEEGKRLVLEALSVLGEEYISILKTAFTDGWIDKYPNRGKTSGAYSSGMYDTLPFVLLNYTDEYDDVSTLAHELGHSMHSYLSNHNNDYINANYPIFLAEIASTVNELLFSYYMEEHTSDQNEKKAILNERLDMFKGTIFRQTMFAEFELSLHEKVDHQVILTADALSEEYYNLNKLYFGEGVVVDDAIRYEWLRIPHFYRPFYVYQYATGLSIAGYIASNILKKTPGFKEKYLELLKSGGKDYPGELLKMIGIDLEKKDFLEDALVMFEETLRSFEILNKEK